MLYSLNSFSSSLLRGLKPLSGKGAASHSGAGAGKGLDDLNLQKLEQAEKTHDPTATKEEEEEEGVVCVNKLYIIAGRDFSMLALAERGGGRSGR